jgi:hypothetical protein
MAPLAAALANLWLHGKRPGGSKHEIRIKAHCSEYIRGDREWELLLNERLCDLSHLVRLFFQTSLDVIDKLPRDRFLTQGTERVVRDIPR